MINALQPVFFGFGDSLALSVAKENLHFVALDSDRHGSFP